MAEKNMTQVQALEIAVKGLEALDPTDEVADAIAIVKHIIEKKRAPKTHKPNAEAVAFREKLVEVMNEHGEPMTNAELTVAMREVLDDETVKPQKIANNIRVLEKNGTVTRVRSKKPSGKDTFILS